MKHKQNINRNITIQKGYISFLDCYNYILLFNHRETAAKEQQILERVQETKFVYYLSSEKEKDIYLFLIFFGKRKNKSFGWIARKINTGSRKYVEDLYLFFLLEKEKEKKEEKQQQKPEEIWELL